MKNDQTLKKTKERCSYKLLQDHFQESTTEEAQGKAPTPRDAATAANFPVG